MERLSTDSRVTRDFPPDARYLIGVSGGRDSVALLHWLGSLGYERLIVCHLNHRLRGRSSDADAQFVKRLVERYNGQALRPPGARTGKRSARPTISRAGSELDRFADLGQEQRHSGLPGGALRLLVIELDRREGVVMDANDPVDADELRRAQGIGDAHGEVIADRQDGKI